jgi:hypothetical protein
MAAAAASASPPAERPAAAATPAAAPWPKRVLVRGKRSEPAEVRAEKIQQPMRRWRRAAYCR